jgi:serralysin
MFTDWIARAANANMEFVTLDDLALRMSALKAATVTTTVNGNTITASVTGSNVGNMALGVDRQGSLVIQNVTGWYAYDGDSVFLPQSGGSFTITLGAVQDDVTHITSLPMRAMLLSAVGDGRNLSFSIQGEGRVVIDIAALGTSKMAVTGATIVSQVGDIVILDIGAIGVHNVALTFSGAPVITSNGGGATAAIAFPENQTAVTTVTATDPDPGTTLVYSIVGGADRTKFTINPTTGALAFITAPNYEIRTDVGSNNV